MYFLKTKYVYKSKQSDSFKCAEDCRFLAFFLLMQNYYIFRR